MGYQTFHDAFDENQAEQEGIDSTQPLGRVHNLYKTGDADAPDVIKDGNGEVVLGLCRDCGKGEIELNGPCVETTDSLPLTDQIDKEVREQLSFEAIRSQPSGHELRIGYIQKTAARIARKAAFAAMSDPCPIDQTGVINHQGHWWLLLTNNVANAINRPEVDLTEEQCFMLEAAEQIADIETIDDDARTYIVTSEQIVKLMTTVRDKTREYERHPIDDLKGYIEASVEKATIGGNVSPDDAAKIAREAADLAVRERIEPFKVNEFIDDEMATLSARFAGLPHWQEQKFIEQEVSELCREVALRVIFDKETLLDNLAMACHAASAGAGWWTDLKTGEDLRGRRNKGELMMLMVSEIAEAMEGARKDLASDKLPGFSSEEEELADLFIRLGDYAGAHKLRLGAAVIAKMRYNQSRDDHKIENRRKAGGKAW